MRHTALLKLSAAILLGLLLASCDSQQPSKQATPREAIDPAAEDQRLYDYVEAWFQREVDESPTFQSYLGINGGAQSEWTDISDAYAAEELAEAKADLADFRDEFDRDELSEDGRLNYDLFVYQLERSIADGEFRRNFYVVDQFRSPFTRPLIILQNNHRIADVAAADAYIARIEGIEELMMTTVIQLKDREAYGVLPPAFAYDPMKTTIRNVLSGAPFDDDGDKSPLYADFEGKVAELDIDEAEAARLMEAATGAMTGPMRRGYEALLAEIERLERIQDDNHGVWAQPNGDAFYETD